MKQRHMKKIVLMGITSGLFITSQANAEPNSEEEKASNSGNDKTTARVGRLAAGCGGSHSCGSSLRTGGAAGGCGSYSPERNRARGYIADNGPDNDNGNNLANQQQPLTEDSLKLQLNERGKVLYDSLDQEGKALALKLANRTCKGKNDCKGQGKDANNCNGKNGCKGKSTCKFNDKNDAVKVAAKLMAEKRGQSIKGSQQY